MQKTNVGHVLDEDGVGGPYTIFVPSNEALNNMKDGTLDYLLSPEVPYSACSDGIVPGALPQSVSKQVFSKLEIVNKLHIYHHLPSNNQGRHH